MAYDFQPTLRLSLLQLLSGLVHGVGASMQQELTLAKHELQGTLRAVQTAISLSGLGAGVAGIGGLWLITLTVYLPDASTGMALRACCGFVVGVFALIGGTLLGKRNSQLAYVHVFPRHTLETVGAHFTSSTGTDGTRGSAVAERQPEAVQTPDSSKKIKQLWRLGGLGAKELGRRVIHEIQHDDCFGRAAQLAYYFLFALFPFFLVLTTLLGYVPVPNLLDRLMEVVAQMLPGDALRLVQENVRDLVMNQRGGLLSFGILAALWTSSSAVTAIMDGLNRAYDVEEGRPFWKVRAYAILLTIGLSLFIIVSITLLTFGPQIGGWIADQVGLGGIFQTAWNLLRWPVIVGLLILAMALIYYIAPDVEQEWQWITPGSVVAVIGWLLASLGFSYYVNNFASYNATYGSIGAVIVLLTWMYVSGFIILVGGEINSEIEHAAASGKDPGEKQLPST